MKRFLHFLLCAAALASIASAQVKLRLGADDVVESGFLTTANSNVLLNGLNLNGTVALNAAHGGTGFSLYALGDILYANGTATLDRLPAAAGLLSGGATPSWISSSSQLAGVISDETGTGSFVLGTNPALTVPTMLTNAVTGAGSWFNGSTVGQRAFLGMLPETNNTFRLFSTQAGTDALLVDLPTLATQFNGSITASGAIVTATELRTSRNAGIATPMLHLSNTIDANLESSVTVAGAGEKYARLGPTSAVSSGLYLQTNGVDRIRLKSGGAIELANSAYFQLLDGTSSATSLRFSGGHGIYNRDDANKTISFGTGLGGNPVFEVVGQTGQINLGASQFLFGSFGDARSNREKFGVITKYATASAVNSDPAAVSNDGEVAAVLGGSETYAFEIAAYMAVGDTTMNMRTGINFTSAPTFLRWKQEVLHTSLLSVSQTSGAAGVSATTGLTTGLEYQVRITGMFTTNAATTFRYSYSQDTDTVNNLTRVPGSYMILHRLN